MILGCDCMKKHGKIRGISNLVDQSVSFPHIITYSFSYKHKMVSISKRNVRKTEKRVEKQILCPRKKNSYIVNHTLIYKHRGSVDKDTCRILTRVFHRIYSRNTFNVMCESHSLSSVFRYESLCSLDRGSSAIRIHWVHYMICRVSSQAYHETKLSIHSRPL